MRKYLSAFIIFMFIVVSCSGTDSNNIIIIMSWNVQNLFDDVDNGTEYSEYDPGNGEWTLDMFNRKSEALADVITSSVSGGPDIVILQEVENNNALQYLNTKKLKAAGYRHSLFLPTENSAIGCGILSRYPVVAAVSHAVNCDGEIKGRNISELDLNIDAGELRLKIFVNHWKSKLGGAQQTEPFRMAASAMLSRLMSAAVEDSQGVMVLAAGDFNESYNESRLIGSAYATAIEDGRLYQDFEGRFFNPWIETPGGSYFYNGKWETIDQFFLSEAFFDASGWDYEGFDTVVLGLNSTAGGLPMKWQTSSATGCSDHFPIIIRLKKHQ